MNKQHRLIGWIRLFASYSFVQAISQGLGFVAGIIIVRALPKEDYALFMVVNSIGPIMNMLSDNGVSSSLCAIGGKFWQDDVRMGSLIKTALLLRRLLLIFSFLSVTPFLIWLLWRNNAGFPKIAWLIPITLAGVYFQLNAGILGVVLTLRQQIGRMQALSFMGVIPRLGLIGLFTTFGWLSSPLAVAASTVALVGQYWLVKRWVIPQISWGAPPDKIFRRDILAIVKRQAPLTIYFCLQGQIGIWLITIFGNVQRVAEVGALGRIGMIFSILGATTLALVVPRFARIQNLPLLRHYYAIALSGFAGIVFLCTLLAWFLPSPLLWLLGSKYSQLGSLVWLAVLAAGTGSLAGFLNSLNIHKGWIPPATVVIPAEILTQLILCFTLDLSSVRGILLMSVLGPITPSLINLLVGLRKISLDAQLKPD